MRAGSLGLVSTGRPRISSRHDAAGCLRRYLGNVDERESKLVQWWCSAQGGSFTWEWVSYPGVWLALLVPTALYQGASRRGRYGVTRRHRLHFYAGIAGLWLATDWPLGTLASGYLLSAQMLQVGIYTFLAVPLLLRAIPEPMASVLANRVRLTGLARHLGSNPALRIGLVSVGFLILHIPTFYDALRASQFGSFAMDAGLVALAIVLWLPDLVDGNAPSAPGHTQRESLTMVLTMGLLPAILLATAPFPFYATYELAPRIGAWHPLVDQRIAAGIMVAFPLLLTLIRTARRHTGTRQHRFAPGPRRGPVPATALRE